MIAPFLAGVFLATILWSGALFSAVGGKTLTILQTFKELLNFRTFLVENLTKPLIKENNVSSLPFLTLRPGQYLVPRCLMIIELVFAH